MFPQNRSFVQGLRRTYILYIQFDNVRKLNDSPRLSILAAGCQEGNPRQEAMVASDFDLRVALARIFALNLRATTPTRLGRGSR